jgi:hypothetical protein
MPNFDIESYKSNFRDGARANLFYFLPMIPGDCIEGDMTNGRTSYLVRSTSLPASTIEEINLNWQGFDFFVGGKHTFSDFTVTFNLDDKGLLRLCFENWINKIHDPVTNEYGTIAFYMFPQRLQLLGYDGTPVMEYLLHHAWPREVAAATLDYSTNDNVQFDVTFRYAYHTLTTRPTGL